MATRGPNLSIMFILFVLVLQFYQVVAIPLPNPFSRGLSFHKSCDSFRDVIDRLLSNAADIGNAGAEGLTSLLENPSDSKEVVRPILEPLKALYGRKIDNYVRTDLPYRNQVKILRGMGAEIQVAS